MTVVSEDGGRTNIYAIEPPIIVMSPSDYEATYGWTARAERLNGRLAMLGVTIAIVTQIVSGSIW